MPYTRASPERESRVERWSKWGQFVVQCVVLGLAAAFVLSLLFPERFGAAPVAAPSLPPAAAAPVDSYAPLVRQVLPTVVNIYTRRIITEQPFRVLSDPMLQRYSGITMMPAQRRQEAILAEVDWSTARLPRAEIEAQLAVIRETGVARSFGERLPDVASIAAVVLNEENKPAGVIVVSGPSTRWRSAGMDRIEPELRRAAQAVSREMGRGGRGPD